MSKSDKMPFKSLPDYWDALIIEVKESKARIAQLELRLGVLEGLEPIPEPIVEEPKEVPEL